ncbi:hypothetical protein [Seonamhaeicola sp. ML3]|uniref:hypothetical protein n=1 Tax=Seonamhaeicola sp. ML3 TaxID=2937786 RepID=UPI00200EBE92|nr:hypothetical protein [Seonamhaeicola sp. ML3]
MKKNLFPLITLLSFLQIFSQDKCMDADSNLIYAYSNIKSAYEANNIDHLKFYSKKSLTSFKEAKDNLKICGCETAYNLAYDAIDLLNKVENQHTYEDGRFYVKRIKEIAQKGITALNEFTTKKDSTVAEKLNIESNDKPNNILEKEKLIKQYEETIALNIKTYNELLKLYGSDLKVKKDDTDKEILLSKSINEIKAYYMVNIKNITNSYLAKLNNY